MFICMKYYTEFHMTASNKKKILIHAVIGSSQKKKDNPVKLNKHNSEIQLHLDTNSARKYVLIYAFIPSSGKSKSTVQ